MLISNSFSLNMVREFPAQISLREVALGEATRLANGAMSIVGHADTAALFSAVLGREVPVDRTSVALKKGDEVLVGQYRGPRLPEGTTTLPDGATIQWIVVSVS